MLILGIETSCDETAVAQVQDGRHIITNHISSSAEIHAATGGIIPEQAARQQLKSLLPLLSHTLKQTNLTTKGKGDSDLARQGELRSVASGGNRRCPPEIDAIAITTGPGLIGSLLVGTETAKALAYLWQKPLIPVNHLIAHIYANWIKTKITPGVAERTPLEWNPPTFPALALVVSGGHTDLVLMKNHDSLKLLGTTRDDAAGEAFDKTARILGLPYPGGPALSQLAQKGQDTYHLPRPLSHQPTLDWSFSGLKTAVYHLARQENPPLHPANLAASIEAAITDILVEKTLQAARKYRPPSLLLSGGVAANRRLREKMSLGIGNLSFNINLYIPPPSLCTDNAAIVAAAAYYHHHPIPWPKVTAHPSLTITSSMNLFQNSFHEPVSQPSLNLNSNF